MASGARMRTGPAGEQLTHSLRAAVRTFRSLSSNSSSYRGVRVSFPILQWNSNYSNSVPLASQQKVEEEEEERV